MKTLYLVRHGESEVNVSTHYVTEESPLTPEGRQQAEKIAERAREIPIDLIVSSTMERARETASIIARAVQKPVEETELFIERRIPESFYGLEKKGEQSLVLQQQWLEGFFTADSLNELGGDNFETLFSRAARALHSIETREEEHILVVTHGFFIRMLLAHVIFGESLTPEMFRLLAKATVTDHTGITLLRKGVAHYYDVDPGEERWKLRVYNDHAHLS